MASKELSNKLFSQPVHSQFIFDYVSIQYFQAS